MAARGCAERRESPEAIPSRTTTKTSFMNHDSPGRAVIAFCNKGRSSRMLFNLSRVQNYFSIKALQVDSPRTRIDEVAAFCQDLISSHRVLGRFPAQHSTRSVDALVPSSQVVTSTISPPAFGRRLFEFRIGHELPPWRAGGEARPGILHAWLIMAPP